MKEMGYKTAKDVKQPSKAGGGENRYENSCYEVVLHQLCNAKCLFCSQDHDSRVSAVRPSDRDIYTRILFGKKQGYGMLGFTGGEPLMHPNVLKYVEFGKKAEFESIRVQTNGLMLGRPGFSEACVRAGVTYFKLSVHHHNSQIHDYLVGVPGALERVNDGIRNVIKLGARIGVNIVLTEQNYRDLPEFLLHYLEMGVTSFVIILPLYEHSMDLEVQTIGFRLTETVPYIVKSLQIFDKLKLRRPLVLNMPMCLLGGYESAIINTFNGTTVLNLDGTKERIDDNKAEGKKRIPLCENCEYNQFCFGVDERYIDYWGDDEFRDKTPNTDWGFDLETLKIKEYFTEDEQCLFEILNIQSSVTVDDIIRLKQHIQICQDCDSLNKIISTGEKFIKKGLVKKEMKNGKITYTKLYKDV